MGRCLMLLAFSAGLTLGATAQKNAKGVEIQNADTWEFDGRPP
jgi:hypothetical protein